MDSLDLNGGNTLLERKEYNLDHDILLNTSEKQSFEEENTSDKEFNSDPSSLILKKNIAISRKKFRKSTGGLSNSKENTEFTALSSTLNLNKRKISDSAELSSGESDEFNGFDLKDLEIFGHGSNILKSLLDEAELYNNSFIKRRKTSCSIWKNVKNADSLIEDTDANTTDSEDQKISIESEMQNVADESSIKSEKSADSSISACSSRSKIKRISYGASPVTTTRQKVSIDINNPAYKEPFNYGWKRELVYRAGSLENQGRRMADIYYYTPEGKKVRSYREVFEFLTTSELTIDNFTFFKEPLGINDPNKEIIRDAKKAKDYSSSKATIKTSKKITDFSAKRSSLSKRGVDILNLEIESTQTTPKIMKTAGTFKVKLPTKKHTVKKETSSLVAPVILKDEVSSPSKWNSPITKRTQQQEQSTIKAKKMIKKKSCQSEVENRQYFMISLCAGYHALSRIFQYLKVQELLRAARVCRMWRDLAAHPSLWKTVRMKNSQVTDWDGLADTLKSRGTQHLDLRKMLIAGEADVIWKKFVATIPQVTSLIKLELCRCPAIVVEEVMKNCPQLQVLSAMSIKCDTLNLEFVDNLYQCQELRLKAISGMSLQGDLMPLLKLSKITHLSLTSVKDLGKKKIEVLHSLQNLETLELGECSDFPEKFGTSILLKLQNLEKLRLEKGQGTCCTFDILEGISKLKNLTQLELVNFDVKNGFDKYLANCKNIKRLLVIPTYVSQSATSNNMILGGVTELSNNLTHFVWGVTQELLRVTELFVDQCNQMNKQITGDSIPVLKPVPCLELIEDVLDDNIQDDKQQSNLSNPQVQILPLPHLQKLLLTALPKTRVKILKIPFHATWRQSISDSTT